MRPNFWAGLLGGALLIACESAYPQAIFQSVVTRYQPLSYSKQGDLSGCGVRILVVTDNEKSIDASINLNFVQGIVAGLFKLGFYDLKKSGDKFVETGREVTFGKLETKSYAIDTKRGQRSDDAGFYISVVEGLPTLQMLGAVMNGDDFTFTVSVKGDRFDHRIVVRQRPEQSEIRLIQDCINQLMDKVEKAEKAKGE